MILILLVFAAVCGAITTILFFAYVYFHENEHDKFEEQIQNQLKEKFLEYECYMFGIDRKK